MATSAAGQGPSPPIVHVALPTLKADAPKCNHVVPPSVDLNRPLVRCESVTCETASARLELNPSPAAAYMIGIETAGVEVGVGPGWSAILVKAALRKNPAWSEVQVAPRS